MSRPAPTPASRVVSSWEPRFRAGMTLPLESLDDPAAIRAAAEALPGPARDLLATILLAAGPGADVPERFRARIDAEGLPLWQMAALLPRAVPSEGHILPTHYAGACRLHPGLTGLELLPPPAPATPPTASWPPTDARWDAVVLAALFEAQPAQLTVEGSLRRDVERRLWQRLDNDEARWSLALRLARLTGLVRPSGDRLIGHPEQTPRPLPDPSQLLGEPLRAAAAAALWRRLPAGETWLDLQADLLQLQAHARDVCFSPVQGAYPSVHGLAPRAWTPQGWDEVEGAWLLEAADVLHRTGLVDAARDAQGRVTALRRAQSPPATMPPGFLLLPDNDVIVHPAELPRGTWGRLARAAPWVEGRGVARHRLTREGVAADLAAGHADLLDFLASHSRTGVPPGVAETLRDWTRSATRVVVRTGVDLLEDAAGQLRRPEPGESVGARALDYAAEPRARFLYEPAPGGLGTLRVPAGADALTVRAALARVARAEGRDEREELVYTLELRRHADPEAVILRLEGFYGGEIPGEVAALIRSGAQEAPVEDVPARMVRAPARLAEALRRDHVAGPLLSRVVSPTESLVDEADVPALRARLEQLGIAWGGR